MSDKAIKSIPIELPQVKWESVRQIYKKLSEEFHVLTNAYNLIINPETKLQLDHLIIIIDAVDNFIDELNNKSDRDSITTSLIDYLKNEEANWDHELAPEPLKEKIKLLKHIVHSENISEKFISAAQSIFHYTEIKRHTLKKAELIDFIIKEGEATAKLPLFILKIESSTPFGKFFSRLCMLMGIADLIFDAKEDYKNGLISIKANLSFYLKLNRIMIKEGLKLFLSFPKKIKFLVYCLKFTIALAKG